MSPAKEKHADDNLHTSLCREKVVLRLDDEFLKENWAYQHKGSQEPRKTGDESQKLAFRSIMLYPYKIQQVAIR
ncbi:uncharacterized protein PHALS_11865 [Plasmopara halstedii]|uniref:Uncharacterized protein n=1 Tax=Plasmopara halstedii TaxID=4781 RepID=A0A0P1AJK4_PLAHL|nr:uncharacterized protein PHALS_11865 [Plasmopara halstedii]CEG41524.1 hypothetical protein PHALS_11865 [Plasmopara halstedii]|eukprot:XP_024577893.1 hypothetical protein PHALS_11865 [Plasmopara halstedii]